jgi:hypothetical protein
VKIVNRNVTARTMEAVMLSMGSVQVENVRPVTKEKAATKNVLQLTLGQIATVSVAVKMMLRATDLMEPVKMAA